VITQVEFFFYNGENKFKLVYFRALFKEKNFSTEKVFPTSDCLSIQLLEETAVYVRLGEATLSTPPTLASLMCGVLAVLAED
jgi:hypothetical protein